MVCMANADTGTMYFDDVAYRVAVARRRLRTLKQAAVVVGLSESYLGQITRGSIPPPETRAQIAQRLGVGVAELWKPVDGVAA